MNIDTKELLNNLCMAEDIKAFIEDYGEEFLNISFPELLNQMSVQKGMNVAEVAKKSRQGDYVYKVFRGERKPSRDIVLTISVGMELSLKETQLLLRVAKMAALDPRDRRDSILIYGLKEKLGVDRLNDLLYEIEEKTL